MQQNSQIIKSREIPEYKKQYIRIFKNELLDFLRNKKDSKEEIYKNIDNIEKLLADKVFLMGKWFYDLSVEHNFDFNKFCKKVFASSKASKLNLAIESDNLLKALLHPFIHSQSDFYTSADIEKTRFSRLLKANKLNELYADEVYGIAIALDVDALTMFKYFFNQENQSVNGLIAEILESSFAKKII